MKLRARGLRLHHPLQSQWLPHSGVAIEDAVWCTNLQTKRLDKQNPNKLANRAAKIHFISIYNAVYELKRCSNGENIAASCGS